MFVLYKAIPSHYYTVVSVYVGDWFKDTHTDNKKP